MIQTIIIALLLTLAGSSKQTLTKNDHVKVEMSVSASKKTDIVEISFLFFPVKGIHINTNPKFELRLEKNSPFETSGPPKFGKTEKEYLDLDTPLVFSVKAKAGNVSGKQTIKGVLNYFYCSDKEGWCNRFTQPIEASVEIE